MVKSLRRNRDIKNPCRSNSGGYSTPTPRERIKFFCLKVKNGDTISLSFFLYLFFLYISDKIPPKIFTLGLEHEYGVADLESESLGSTFYLTFYVKTKSSSGVSVEVHVPY